MPELSVVIPTWNRSERLRACLAALSDRTASPESIEVLVVDDGSTDDTGAMLERLELPFPLRVLRSARAGAGGARNVGVDAASAPYCLFLDDDVIAETDVVAAHLAVQRAVGGAVGLGHIDRTLPPGADGFARARRRQLQAHFEALAGGRPASFTDCYTGNMSAPRQHLLAAGGFEPLEHEDDLELGYRLEERGLPFAYVPDARVSEDHRELFHEVVADAEGRGRASLTLYALHPAVLPRIELGGRGELERRWLLLRYALLAARVPPRLLRPVGALVPRQSEDAWYRFLFSYCYWRGVRAAASPEERRRLTRGALVLMYHAVGGTGEAPSRYVVPAHRLERQLQWLVRRGYTVVPLEELLQLRREHRLPPPRTVVITFDDGYRDNFELAAPILRELGLSATVFLVSDGGDANTWTTEGPLAGRPLVALEEAAAFPDEALRFGAHTRTHRPLTELDDAEAEREIAGSRRELERALGRPVTTFAFPFGKQDGRVRAIVREAGFLGACGTAPGRNRPSADDFALQRYEVYGQDSIIRFALAVWLGWMPARRRPARA